MKNSWGHGTGLSEQEGNRTILFKQLRAAVGESDGNRASGGSHSSGFLPQYMEDVSNTRGVQSSITKDFRPRLGTAGVGGLMGSKPQMGVR